MSDKRLLFQNIVSEGIPFHAILTTLPNEIVARTGMHGHDFFEWMIPLEGSAVHSANGVEFALTPGQLILVRPTDVHAVRTRAGESFRFINIAFSTSVWDDFVRAFNLDAPACKWKDAAMPISVDLLPHRRQTIENEALNAVRLYCRGATRLEFSRFWNEAIEAHLEEDSYAANPISRLPWLHKVLDESNRVDVAELTVKMLTDESGVTFAHLCRTMKSCLGVTPTQYINQLRINRATYELASTNKQIIEIAYDCGFQNLSYFYRRFRNAHSISPRQYRLEIMRAVSG
jgi:AraC family cel operon transcriptional repressor